MFVALSLVLPIFFVIGVGYGAVRTGLLTDRAIDGIDTYVFSFAMPALLFRSLATTELPTALPWGLWLSYYIAMLGVWAFGSLVARYVMGRPFGDAVLVGFGGGQGNTIMLGVPIILTGFGEEAGPPLFFLLAFHGLILITLATFLMELDRGRQEGLRPSTGEVVKAGLLGSVRNPVILGLGFGVIYGQSGLALPGVIDTALEMLGRTAIPCALFVLGAMLTRYHIRRSVGAASWTSSLKLIVHPLCVWLLATYVFALPPLWVIVATVLAAMPTGVYSSILANRYQAAPGAVSSTVVMGTGLSLVTITILLSFFLPVS